MVERTVRRRVGAVMVLLMQLTHVAFAWSSNIIGSWQRSNIGRTPLIPPQRMIADDKKEHSSSEDCSSMNHRRDNHAGRDAEEENSEDKHQGRTNQTKAHHHFESRIEKKIRVAKAQAEIDRILSGPDAPFDVETELKKVIRITPPLSTSMMDNQDDELEEEEEEDLLLRQEEAVCAELEHELYESVKRQDYGTAAHKRRQLNQLHMDDSLAVLQANAAFYRAFSQKNYREMEALWLQDDTSTCIHPSHRPLVGAKTVCESWKRMFAAGSGGFQRSWVEPDGIRLTVRGAATAVVTCEEHVYARRFVRGRQRETERVNLLTATNIFRKVSGRWYIAYHHASWHADSDAAKQALRGGGRSRGDDDSSKNESAGMDGILGISNFGPLLGNEDSSSSNPQQQQPQRKRIVMGSLSDILGGNLDNLFSNNGGKNGPNININKGNNEGNAIIRFQRVEEVDEDDDDDDDDDDEEDEEDDDDDDDEDMEIVDVNEDSGGQGTVSIIKEWAESSSSSGKTSSSSAPRAPSSPRQRCIALLRKLSSQGSISPKQKRVLLTDIISCSAKGESSMVEVAYELLIRADDDDDDDDDIAEEEFADQCRVFAESLPDSHVTSSFL